jgi:hypothetical protein
MKKIIIRLFKFDLMQYKWGRAFIKVAGGNY